MTADGIRAVEVADGVIAVLNGDGRTGLANSAVLVDGAEAVVVDAMLLPSMAATTCSLLERRCARARTVLVTHNHVDHLGGCAAFPEARVVAHPTTARIIGLMAQDHPWLPGLFPDHAADLADLRFPRVDGDLGTADLPLDSRTLLFEHTHSPADVAVWLPGPRVLVAGDLCSNGVVPMARHGRIGRWIDALDVLTGLAPDVVVPGHGPVCDVGTLRTVRDYLAGLLAAARLIVHGSRDRTADRAPGGGLPTAMAGWSEPQRHAVNLRVAVAELSGRPLPVGPPR